MSPEACGKALELNRKLLGKGLPSVESVRDKLNACTDDSCRKTLWREYQAACERTVETLKQMALNGELSREELALINSGLGKELALQGRTEGDRLGISEWAGWTNGGNGPLSGFFNTELREAELVRQGLSPEDAAQYLKEEQRNQMLLESAAGAIGSKVGGKLNASGSKGSAIPYPESVKAKNGLVYQSNGKHKPGQQGYSLKVGTESMNSMYLFGESIESGKKRYALDVKGNVHQFTNTNDGTWHWSGSTGDTSVLLNKRDAPNNVRKQFGPPGKWR